MKTITIIYHAITFKDLTDAAAESVWPIVAIGAGVALAGLGLFAIISKALSIVAERNAKPHRD